jgi:hypothetical protein
LVLPVRAASSLLIVALLGIGACDLGDTAENSGRSPSAVPIEAGRLLAEAPYMGVACVGRGNYVGCDRVRLALRFKKRPRAVGAWIAGKPVEMHAIEVGGPDGLQWWGSLRPAHLHDEPFNLPRGRSHWYGTPRAHAPVRVAADTGDGERRLVTTQRVRLREGFG